MARGEGSNQGDAPVVGKKGNPTLGAGLNIIAAIATKLTAVQGPALMVGTAFICMLRKFIAIGNAELGLRVFLKVAGSSSAALGQITYFSLTF